MRYFFYGTLLDHAVRKAVLGELTARLSVEPAFLSGWKRVHMKGRSYPVVVPDSEFQVDGCLTQELPAAALTVLDRFEGAEYRRTILEVRTESGEQVSASIYVARGLHLASTRPWNFDDWARRDRKRYLQRG